MLHWISAAHNTNTTAVKSKTRLAPSQMMSGAKRSYVPAACMSKGAIFSHVKLHYYSYAFTSMYLSVTLIDPCGPERPSSAACGSKSCKTDLKSPEVAWSCCTWSRVVARQYVRAITHIHIQSAIISHLLLSQPLYSDCFFCLYNMSTVCTTGIK